MIIMQMKYTPTKDQEKAILLLEKYGFKRSKFIKLAIEEKLKRDFRIIYNELRRQSLMDNNIPQWMYDKN